MYDWAKAPVKPTYEAKDITGMDTYISEYVNEQMGISVDTDTQYQLVKVNDYSYKLQSKGKTDEAWGDVAGSTIAIPNDTAAIEALQGLVGSETVAKQIGDAITALDLANTYAAKVHKHEIADVNGLTAAIADAKKAGTDAQTNLETYIGTNDKALADEIARADAAEKVNAAAAKAAQDAADAAQGAADAAQGDVNALSEYVGDIPEGATAETIVAYIDEKTANVTSGDEFVGLQNRVKAIEDDYLVEADKTELSNAIDAEKQRAEGIEGGLRTDVNTILGDYLKTADKEELAGAINTEKGRVDTLVGTDTGKSARTIAAEELAKQLIPETAAESLNTLEEIAAWIQDHPGDASAMNEAIQKNAADIATNVTAIANNKTAIEANDAEILQLQNDVDALEELVGVLPEGATATTVVGYVDEAVAALKIADYAKAADLAAAVERIAALEGKAHEHANKALLDTYTQTEANLADAVAKKHEHANAGVLNGITAEKAAAWDAAEQNAKDYADDAVEALDGKLAGIAKTGNVNDLVQTTGDVLVFDCGTSAV